MIFDLGTAFTGSGVRDARERRLREDLERNTKDALAAANLAAILIQKQEYDEARSCSIRR